MLLSICSQDRHLPRVRRFTTTTSKFKRKDMEYIKPPRQGGQRDFIEKNLVSLCSAKFGVQNFGLKSKGSCK